MSHLSAISHGFRGLLRHKWLILLVFIINMLFGIVALSPFKSIISQSLSTTHYPGLLAQDFDFVIWTDVIREHLSSIGMGFKLLLLIIGIYTLWSIFYISGFTGLALSNDKQAPSSVFWSSGARYFFRFLRLSIYTILIYLFIIALLLWYMGITDLHILDMESEVELIFKCKVSSGLLLLSVYIISVFKELAKIAIATSDQPLFTASVLNAAKQTFAIKYLLLGVILSSILFIAFVVYYLLSEYFGLKPRFLSILILPQLLLLVRIAMRYVQLSAFAQMYKSSLPLS